MKKRPTIKDIAKEAGVTHSTVSRVINNNPAIGEETRLRVLEIIKRMDYQPNLIARGLVRKKTHSFALIAPELNPHVLPIIRGITDTCRRYNYGLMLFSTDYWSDEGLSYIEVVRNWLVDGVFIYNVVYHKEISEAVKALQKENTPFVFINKYLGTKKVNNISVDNYDAVFQVISHLVSAGRKRIGILNGGLMSVDGFERFEAYKEVLKKLNLDYDESIVGTANFFFNEAYEEMKRILCISDRPTAMFCANDEMATGAITAIEEKGLKVPQDIAIVGFDDWVGARFFKPSLSTVRAPLEDIGGKALELMMKLMEDSKRPIEEIPLKAKLIVRESSGG